jgi:hypothetical protein
MYGPQLEDQNVSQYLILPSDHSVNVPYLSWYIVWASDSNGNYVETGYPNTTGRYLPIFWDRQYDPSVIVPTVFTYPVIFYDYHERVEYMHHIVTHIPFDNALQLVTNAVTNNGEEAEECKDEYDFDDNMEIALPTALAPGQDRQLDAIHIDDDMDETMSLIWVQCRRCKWSCPVESYIVGDCDCTWIPAEGLDEEMQALDMAANIMGEDIAEWSEIDDTHDVHSVHGDTTEGELTDTSSDDMPPLIDAPDDSDHEEAEVPALLHNVVLSMPTYPISAELCIRYIDDTITTTIDPKYITCSKCNLPWTGSYEDHVYECNRHVFCAIHNRWEGHRHGFIRCDTMRDMSYKQPEQLPTPTWSTGLDPSCIFWLERLGTAASRLGHGLG